MKRASPSSSKEEIVLQHKKHFFSLERRNDFYEWFCEEFCEKDPWDCDNCQYEKVLEEKSNQE